MTVGPLAIVLAVAGAAWGFAADRLSTRWPEHDEGFQTGRPVGWRTILVVLFGAIGLGALPGRFDPASDLLALVVFGAYVTSLVLLLATDLDQRLIPGIVTAPTIVVGLVLAASGANPLVGSDVLAAVVAAIAIPAALFIPSLAFGRGAFGIGDVYLLAGLGLLVGAYRAILGTVAGVFLAGPVIAVLLVTRRVTLKTFVPYGPFLILGALWAMLVRT